MSLVGVLLGAVCGGCPGPDPLAGDVAGVVAGGGDWTDSDGLAGGVTETPGVDGVGGEGPFPPSGETPAQTDELQVPDLMLGTMQDEALSFLIDVGVDGGTDPGMSIVLVSGPHTGQLVEWEVQDSGVVQVTFAPSEGFVGTAQFSYTATDGVRESNVGTIVIHVYPTIVFGVDPSDGEADLTVEVQAYTLNGDPLPEGTYLWSFDDQEEAGPVSSHSTLQHTFQRVGQHIVTLSVALAGLSGPIACHGPSGDSAKVDVTVRESSLDDPDGTPADPEPGQGDGSPGDPPDSPTPPPENNAPIADALAVHTAEDSAATLSLQGSDADGDSLVVVVGTLPEHGVLRDAGSLQEVSTADLPYGLALGGQVIYEPQPDFNGSDQLTFGVSDGEADSPVVAVDIIVDPVNDPPSFVVPDLQTAAVGKPLAVPMTNVSPGPADEAKQAVAFHAVSSDESIIPNSHLVFAGTELTITPVAAGGPVTLTVTAEDDGGTALGGQDEAVRTFEVEVAAPTRVSGTIRRTATVGASPVIGPVELLFVGSGDWNGTDFDVVTNAHGTFSLGVPEGWTGVLAAANPAYCRLDPPARVYADPVRDVIDGQDFEAWLPPMGIPAPEFGLTETHTMYADAEYDFGEGAEPYRDAGNGPYTHYVDNTHASATDSGNPFGTPDQPRLTVPQNLGPGSVVEVHGGPYSYGPGYMPVNGQGTADAPIFIRGIGWPRFAIKMNVWSAAETESHYMIFEGLDLHKWQALAPSAYITLRNSEVHGDGSSGGAYAVSFSAPHVCHHVLVYDNQIHDNGDWLAGFDQDIHGVRVSARCHHVWVLDNELFHNSGDGLQINASSLAQMPTTHHIYVGRNLAYENKQTGLWTKQAVDVIFSQNEVHSHRPMGESPSAWGAGMGYQYGPERVWFLFNHIHDCSYGIQATSTSGLGDGQSCYLIGNVIHDIHHHPDYTYNPQSAWSNAAITLVGVPNRYIVNNTLYDVDAGINGPSGGSYHVVNNIIAEVTEAEGNHIFVENAGAAADSLSLSNVLEGDARIRWGGAQVYTLAMFEGLYPENAAGSVNADPQFTDVSKRDLHLAAGSPAIDLGILHDVYSIFEELYGINITVDVEGGVRQTGAACDAGAFEHGGL